MQSIVSLNPLLPVLSERHSGWNVFLELENIEAAQKAIEAIVKIPFKNLNLHASSSRGPKAPNGKTNTVVIGNVGRQIPAEELSEYLQKNFTGVKSARVGMEPSSSRSRPTF